MITTFRLLENKSGGRSSIDVVRTHTIGARDSLAPGTNSMLALLSQSGRSVSLTSRMESFSIWLGLRKSNNVGTKNENEKQVFIGRCRLND